jgi:hypothetical protein
MIGKANLRWDQVNEALVDSCGYVLLAVATFLGVIGGDGDTAWRLTTLGIAAGAAAWIYVMYTRLPRPKKDQRLRIIVFFVGLLVFASVLLIRQPVFFIFMISGFFYASMLRPLPLAVVGVGATSILVNSLIAGLPTTAGAWTFYLALVGAERGASPGSRPAPGRDR